MKGALEVVDRVRPDVVVGFGGYVSVPAYLAARRRHVPIVVHEGNALPGLANKLGARFTTHVATSFPGTPLRHAAYVGLPIRRMISTLDRSALRAEARASSASTRTGRRCWSPAARRARVASTRPSPRPRPASPPQASRCCTWSARRARPRSTRPAGQPPYVVLPYVDRMDLAYAAADLVVCRAGANTVTEVAAVGLPAVFVPLPIGNGEQDAQRAPGGRRRRRAARRGRRAHPRVGAPRTVPGLATDADRLAAMSAAAAGADPARRRRALARIVLDAGRERRR